MKKPHQSLAYTDDRVLSTQEFIVWLKDNGESCKINLLRVDLNIEEFRDSISEAGMKLVPSSDGDVGEVKDDGDNTDLSRSSQEFVLHTDGPYYQIPPCLVILNCVNPSKQKKQISTIFRDTEELIKKIPKEKLDVLKDIDFVYHGKNEQIRRPLLENWSGSNSLISNFGGRGHLECRDEKKHTFYAWLEVCSDFFDNIYAPDTPLIAHDYKRFDTVVFNNHKYLHGRENTTGEIDYERTLNRIWVDFV